LEGHTDSVWDLCLLPPREIVPPGKKPSEGRLVSSSADGTVKLWRYDPDVGPGGQWKLSASWSFEGNVNPTCLGVCNTDFAKVLIGFYDGTVKVWDVEEGVEVQSFGESSNGEWSSRSRGTVVCRCNEREREREGVWGLSGGAGRVEEIVPGARLTARRGRRAGQCRAQPSDTARHHHCAGEWADPLLRRKVL
jgi:WD40 repeat protein